MSYLELARLGVTFRPIDEWPGPLTRDRRRSLFRGSLSSTVNLLARELQMLGATKIVLQLDVRETDLRVDGLPYADAKTGHPGVMLAFESKWGPLKYATDEFTTWQDNLRAAALGMEALRAVDRYGVSKRGEQYRGWRQLLTGTDPADAIATREQAFAFLAKWDGDWKRAVRETHPDTGGDPDEFRKVMRAKELLP